MDRELTRYRLDKEEVEPLIKFLKEKEYCVEEMDNGDSFIFTSTPDGAGTFVHGCGYIRKKEASCYNLEIFYGGDPLAHLVNEYHTSNKQRKLQELIKEHLPWKWLKVV